MDTETDLSRIGLDITDEDSADVNTDNRYNLIKPPFNMEQESTEQRPSNGYAMASKEGRCTEEDTIEPQSAKVIPDNDHQDSSSEDEEGEDGPQRKNPDTIEEKFIAAIESGKVNIFMDMISSKEQLGLDVNYENENGETPLILAVAAGSSVMVESLLSHGVHVGDALLRAVDVGFEETIQQICRYASTLPTPDARLAILNCHCENDEYHPDITPIVLAAQRNDFSIVKLLRDYGCEIEEVGSKKKKKASSKALDDLQKSVGSLEIYRGLASEAYLSQVNEDPVGTAFKLSKKLRNLSQTDVEFKQSYLELAETTDVVGTEIISHARDTEEMLTVLNHRDGKASKETRGKARPLPKISRAIYFNQKHFVAHQNCQQAVLSQFYGHMAFLRDKSVATKLLFFVSMVLCFPFLSLLYLYVPVKWVKTYIGSPYMKFVLKFGSDLIHVFIITADIVLHDRHNHNLALQRPTMVLLFIWMLGITLREMKMIKKQKLAALTQFNHWRDILLVIFFLSGISLDIVSYENKQKTDTVISVSVRDTSYNTYPMFPDAESDVSYNLTNSGANASHNVYIYVRPVLHRVALQIRKPGKGAGPAAGEGGDRGSSAAYQIYAEFLGYYWWHPRLLANALFSLATVISLLRMLPYVVVSNVIGPIQISLGSMVTRTAHFFLVVAVVLFSFAVGLCYIYSYYEKTKTLTCQSIGEPCAKGYFSNLFFAVLFLYWSALGMETQGPLKLDDQAHALEAAGLVLYGMFYVLLIIVLLNALIAVMSEVYNEVEENADVEWKFHSTVMWMSIMLDDDVVPPPFNLLPSYKSIKNLLSKYVNCIHRIGKRRTVSLPPSSSVPSKPNSNNKNDRYKHVISQLVERYVMAKTADEVSVEAGIGFNDILGLRNDLQALKMEMFHKLDDTKNHIDHTTVDGSIIRDTWVRAKNVLHKAEEIHQNVDADLLATVVNFKSKVDERKSEIPQVHDILVVDCGTQYEADVREVLSQTMPQGTEMAVQTEEIREDEEQSGAKWRRVAQLVSAYENSGATRARGDQDKKPKWQP